MLSVSEWEAKTGFSRDDLSPSYLDWCEAHDLLERTLGAPGKPYMVERIPKAGTHNYRLYLWWRKVSREYRDVREVQAIALPAMAKLMKGVKYDTPDGELW